MAHTLEHQIVLLNAHIDNLNDELKVLRANYVWVCDRLKQIEPTRHLTSAKPDDTVCQGEQT